MSTPVPTPTVGTRGHRVLLADGSVALVRRLDHGDWAAVDSLHRSLPDDDRYLRFFSASTTGPQLIADVVVADDEIAVGAFRGDRLLGVAHFRRESGDEDPEMAMAVAHPEQHSGIGSLLLEHLAAAAAAEGVARLSADVLTVNHGMLRVLRDSGLPISSVPAARDVRHVVLRLDLLRPGAADAEAYARAVVAREVHADVASLRPLLAPRSVVVVGAGRRTDSVGRMVLRSIVEGGFTGPVYAVNPHAGGVAGVPCVRSVADLPGVDLAVLCVPAAAVAEVAEECGAHGVRALLVITAGISGDAVLAAGLAAAVERHGMRMVGPNCLGLTNTDPGIALQATFGRPSSAGEVGVAAQSGGVIVAVTAELDRLGLGASTVVSTGDSADVNADDMLLWWSEDGRTRAAVLYVESLRRPRTFAMLARRLARQMPVLTVRSGSSEPGRLAAASHSAGSATPRVVRDALFAQAGVLAVDELTELPGLLALLCRQPLPAGDRVAVLSNAGGAGVLAADACRAGLVVGAPERATAAALAALLPSTAAVYNPVDTTATVPAATFGRALELLLADPGVDAALVLSAPTGAGDPIDGIAPVVAGRPGKPVVAVWMGQPETVTLPAGLGPGDVAAPAFAEPAAASRALAAAARRGGWLRRAAEPASPPQGVDAAAVRAVVATASATSPDPAWPEPRWIDPEAAGAPAAAGLPVVQPTVVHGAEAAIRCWHRIGGPVAVKADVPGVVHKNRIGAVRTGLDSRRQVGAAVHQFRHRFGRRLRGIIVQPMVREAPSCSSGSPSTRCAARC